MRFRALVALVMSLCTPAWVLAQTPGTGGLDISILKGEGGRNSIKSRTGVPIEIEVRDKQDKPVVGAQVIFQLPSTGASGSFPGGRLQERTTTGPAGQAVMSGFVPNGIEGSLNVRITASSGAQQASAVVSQVNVASYVSEAKKHSNKTLLILLGVGAAAGIGAGVALGSGGKGQTAAAPPPSVTVVPGTITVGGPR
jgi:hypothetical protein